MRRTLVIPDPPLPLPPDASPIHAFCDVCRYILVDNVDPTKHGENDRDYRDRRWPEPKPP
jgi:hypothetical protein